MNDALVHRGPDGEGFWNAPPDAEGWGAMLAHRRLSILDLSNAGAQPMVDPTSGDVVVANCEIYNYVEIRNRLAAAGHGFKSSGDTAVMLRALSVEGHSAVAKLRGMFAFACWNVSERTLLLARDPMGIKPLYMARNQDPCGDWSLVFASEVRAILASGLLRNPRLNPAASASMIWNGFIVGPQTAVTQIEAISPGEFRVFDSRGSESIRHQYWNMARRERAEPVDEQSLAQVLDECVRLHLASDAPLGVFLSGGIDSSAVANLAQRASGTQVSTFTLAFDEQEFNEGIIARQVAAAIGTRHQELVLTEQHFMNQLDSALQSLDQPTFDGLNSYYMSHAVREAGFKVALVGSGGDELFGGYRSFRDLPTLMRWSGRARWVPFGLRSALGKIVSSVMQPARGTFSPQTRWAKLPELLRRSDDPLALYQLSYALFLPDFQRQLLESRQDDSISLGLPLSMLSRLELETGSRSPLSAISVMEQRLFLGERLLRDTDAVSMSASIEIRLPLVDQILFEHVDRLSDHARFNPLGAKSTLRRIGLRGLDPAPVRSSEIRIRVALRQVV